MREEVTFKDHRISELEQAVLKEKEHVTKMEGEVQVCVCVCWGRGGVGDCVCVCDCRQPPLAVAAGQDDSGGGEEHATEL